MENDREDWFVQLFIQVWSDDDGTLDELLTRGDNASAVALIRKMIAARKAA
jgi:hypothetical protein